MPPKKIIKVTQYTVGMYTTQFRYWLDGQYLGMIEVFLNHKKYYPS